MVELLLVILTVGILAAVAIPSLMTQGGKAYDASAKSQVRVARIAMEAFATDHNGTYAGVTKSDRVAIEPTLGDIGSATLEDPSGVSSSGYALSSTAGHTGDTFMITAADGVITLTCTSDSGGSTHGGCPPSGRW